MEFAYQFQGRSLGGSAVSGLTFGPDALRARAKLQRAGYTVHQIRLDLPASLRTLLSPAISIADLIRVYDFCAGARQAGSAPPEMLPIAAELVFDARLRQALESMALMIHETGVDFSEAARQTGVFPVRDVEVIRAMEQAGNLAEALSALAADHRRTEERRTVFRRMMMGPVALLAVFYCLTYGALGFILPTTAEAFLRNFGSDLPAFADGVYRMAIWYRAHLPWMTALHLALGIGAIAFVRSALARRLVLSFKLPYDIAERADLAMMWSSYRLLYRAGMSKDKQAKALQRMATLEANRTRARRFASYSQTQSEYVAAERAQFPKYVSNALKAGQGGSIPEHLEKMVAEQINIVNTKASLLATLVNVGSTLGGALLVFVFVAITLLPGLLATLTHL
ncbi:hypothetical protein BUE93_20380 [Chromobacterium amazonense]|uniref:Type II secretion system protein GspF domain-containing protein n=1 Tax=Chromobacterium amazonense TaxID=1382803 RepID=A0A2S9WZI0_9NEIS|nr:type II secretion system F family protein [Chromobacterium amazonense]PRP68806.1 hypothetical protein BUE93_20380 [Chromobacterium amazonense]